MTGDQDVELDDALADLADVAERLLRAVGWLRVLLAPGQEPRPAPPVLSDRARQAAAAQARAEAADRRANLAAGLTAGGASPAPLRVRLLDVQERVVRRLRELAARVGRAGGPRLAFRSPAGLVEAVDRLAGLTPRWTVTAGGEVDRWGGVLADVGQTRLARDAADELALLAELVRDAVGIRADRVVPWPGGRCPACRLRTLQVDATLRDPRRWTVACISESCRCSGTGCPCRRRVRYAGRSHAWGFGELDGPFGLRAAIARAAAIRHEPVRSGMEGTGDRA